MALKTLTAKTRWRHCSEVGIKDDYCIIYGRKTPDESWTAVATCHSSVIEHIKRDGLRAHASLLRLCSPDDRTRT